LVGRWWWGGKILKCDWGFGKLFINWKKKKKKKSMFFFWGGGGNSQSVEDAE